MWCSYVILLMKTKGDLCTCTPPPTPTPIAVLECTTFKMLNSYTAMYIDMGVISAKMLNFFWEGKINLYCCIILYKFKGAGVPISCILALCVGESCHCISYHDLAWLTIYGTTAKRPICISGHWYILVPAIEENADCWRLAGAAPAWAWHLL